MNYLIKGVIIFILAVMAIVSVNYVLSDYSERPQDTTSASKSKDSSKSEPIKTKYIWKDSKGDEYPVYISSNGSCFVIKTKTGKNYKAYLDEDIAKMICKELGVEYKK